MLTIIVIIIIIKANLSFNVLYMLDLLFNW